MENNEEETKKKKGGIIMGALIGLIAILLATSIYFGYELSGTEKEKIVMETEGKVKQEKYDRLLTDLNKTKDLLEQAKTGDPVRDQELQAKSAEIERLREKLKSYESEGDVEYFRKIKAELWKLRNEIRDLKKKNEQLLAEVAKLTDENGQKNSTINSLNSTTKDLKQNLQSLEERNRLATQIMARDMVAEGIRQRRNSERVSKSPRNVERIRFAFTLNANLGARAGMKTIYLRCIEPGGAIFTNGGAKFTLNGQETLYSERQDVDYQNRDLDVIMYATPYSSQFVAGTYTLEAYMDGYKLGTATVELK
ncbi:MAG: hypothetical protein NT150_12920 [Bacteroidetes bacterium]|nr:hypothetical protein [Bacteroidota bacterium]